MARRGTPIQLRNADLTLGQINQGISRLTRRLDEVRAFDVSAISRQFNNAEVDRLKVSVEDGLARTFGHDTVEFRRYSPAASFSTGPIYINQEAPPHVVQQALRESQERAVALLEQAIASLREQASELDAQEMAVDESAEVGSNEPSRRVFIVHGHDEGAREMVARFLERLGFEAIILHERANRGRTVIEKVEAFGDVGFAVVLLTPDDFGGEAGAEPSPRVRQNVLLELGYFLGRLGRSNVCALKRGEPDIPSDFAGVIWEPMDERGGWQVGLARELKAAGHSLDWNAVMRG